MVETSLPPSSLLVLILDLNSHEWEALALANPSQWPNFGLIWAQLVFYLRAFFSLNVANNVAVVALCGNSSKLIYPLPQARITETESAGL